MYIHILYGYKDTFQSQTDGCQHFDPKWDVLWMFIFNGRRDLTQKSKSTHSIVINGVSRLDRGSLSLVRITFGHIPSVALYDAKQRPICSEVLLPFKFLYSYVSQI